MTAGPTSGPLLAIDTAFDRCSAGLYDLAAGLMLASAEPVIGKGHAERLIGIVGDVLAEAGLRYGELSKLVVTVGPGSFTGLRVGVSAVRGLALALGIPAVGVSTLEAMAAPFAHDLGEADVVLAVLDAKRGELYAALYGRDGEERAAPVVIAPEDLPAFLRTSRKPLQDERGPLNGHPGRFILVGSGAEIACRRLAAEPGLADRVTILSSEARVDIAALAGLGAVRRLGGPPVPLYLRGADARPAPPAAGLTFSGASLSQAVRV